MSSPWFLAPESRKFVRFLSRNAASPVLLRMVQDVSLTGLHKLLFVNLSQVRNFVKKLYLRIQNFSSSDRMTLKKARFVKSKGNKNSLANFLYSTKYSTKTRSLLTPYLPVSSHFTRSIGIVTAFEPSVQARRALRSKSSFR